MSLFWISSTAPISSTSLWIKPCLLSACSAFCTFDSNKQKQIKAGSRAHLRCVTAASPCHRHLYVAAVCKWSVHLAVNNLSRSLVSSAETQRWSSAACYLQQSRSDLLQLCPFTAACWKIHNEIASERRRLILPRASRRLDIIHVSFASHCLPGERSTKHSMR